MNGQGRHTAARTIATLGLSAVLAAGCGGGGGITPPKAAPTTTATGATTSAAPTSTTVGATKAAILAGYRAHFAAFSTAASQYPVDPFDPHLAATMTGTHLTSVRNQLTAARRQGQHAMGMVDLAPVVTEIDGTTAIISDCLFDHGRIVDGRTGQTVSGPDTERLLMKVTMQLEAGIWKVAASQNVGSGCVPSA